ncbi:MAG TPA: hypothetical protein VLE43_05220 [Candidatus Saccharimonadia bacterium]|nr:hypothetical protein [Candidatus Saccharimonadia bacterium]
MNSSSFASLLAAAALSLAGTVNGQAPEPATTAPPPSVSKPVPGLPPLEAAKNAPLRELSLNSGNLIDVISELESSYQGVHQQTGRIEDVVPTIVYGPGAKEARVDGTLRLLDARATDALVLVAAAAGCSVEPIRALPQENEDPQRPLRVVGYRITLTSKPASQSPENPALSFSGSLMPGGPVGTVGLMLVEKNGDIMIRDVLPGLPAAQSKAIVPGEKLLSIAEEGVGEVPAATLGWARATQMLTGEPGSTVKVTVAPPHGDGAPRVVLLTREPLFVDRFTSPPPFVKVVEPMHGTMSVHPGGGVSGTIRNESFYSTGTLSPGGAGAGRSFDSNPIPPPTAAANATLVRIYPVAFILSGDENQVAEKQRDLEQLVMESLEHAKLHTDEAPLLSLHRGTKVLIVKATAAQHEIIQQIITALKENESAGAQGSNSLRR